jgi:hypothetical protein
MKFLAKPNLNNSRGEKVFENARDAVAYLEEITGYKMDFVRKRKITKENPIDWNVDVIYDWELIGKLKRI